MGMAVAAAARNAGHDVTLVLGPVERPAPRGVRVVSVVSAREMHEAVLRAFDECDCLVMAAAVADYTPARPAKGKMKKRTGPMTLRLARTADILADVASHKGPRAVIGFALEVQSPVRNALRKLREKNLDAVVLNGPAAFGAGRRSATILTRSGERLAFQNATTGRIARAIVRLAEEMAQDET